MRQRDYRPVHVDLACAQGCTGQRLPSCADQGANLCRHLALDDYGVTVERLCYSRLDLDWLPGDSDGIDIVNSERVLVEGCLIRTGDDEVVVKVMAAPPVLGGRDITVRRCTVWNDKVRCFGITGVMFEDCGIVHSLAVWTEELGSLCIIVGDRGDDRECPL